MTELPADLGNLCDQLDAVDRDARLLVEGLGQERGGWRANPDSWSVAQCLEHLALTNHVYLGAMGEPATRARGAGRLRRGPALPGVIGRWVVSKMESPGKGSSKLKAIPAICPGPLVAPADALARFLESQDEVRDYLRKNADLDLRSIRFPNPFVPGIRFSVATGLHIIAAHDRRHMGQAWRARRAAEAASKDSR